MRTSWAEQLNAVTSFLDLSNVYGSTEKVAMDLRGSNNGRKRDGKLLENSGLNDFNLPKYSELGAKTEEHQVRALPYIGLFKLLSFPSV